MSRLLHYGMVKVTSIGFLPFLSNIGVEIFCGAAEAVGEVVPSRHPHRAGEAYLRQQGTVIDWPPPGRTPLGPRTCPLPAKTARVGRENSLNSNVISIQHELGE